ncbi:MAG: sigma-70 family RNA polymerase sigma factor [Treponema sp.]|jgi:RNA polymerase sigma-70 factor (ECF subfamily)|nr:sigma-70 family RNA polymerase sigma factor [Treponema sp.]
MPPDPPAAVEGGAEQDAAFNGIFKRYYEKILKFCVYALGGDRSAAEDCAQDIFLILYENMGRLKDYDKIGGWLYKTAGNISKQYAASLRKNRKRFAASFSVSEAEDGEAPLDRIAAENRIKTDEEQIAEERAVARAVAEIRKRLTPKDKQILALAFRGKHPLKEVAARLGISLSAAKSRASRLRQKVHVLVRELLADWI